MKHVNLFCFFHCSTLKQQFAASRNKIDGSSESEPNSEVPDHKPNEPVDAKTLLAARNNRCVKRESFIFGGEEGAAEYFRQSCSHYKGT